MSFCEMQPNIFIILFYGFFAFGSIAAAKTAVHSELKSGPYAAVVRRFGNCEKLIMPFAKDRVAVIYNEMQKNIMKGNLTVFRKNSNFQIAVQDFYNENGKWQLTFYVKKATCRNRLMAIVLNLIGIKYDKKTCAVVEGTYPYEVDYNQVDHLWMPSRDYGRMRRHLEIQSKDGTIACWELEYDVKPM